MSHSNCRITRILLFDSSEAQSRDGIVGRTRFTRSHVGRLRVLGSFRDSGTLGQVRLHACHRRDASRSRGRAVWTSAIRFWPTRERASSSDSGRNESNESNERSNESNERNGSKDRNGRNGATKATMATMATGQMHPTCNRHRSVPLRSKQRAASPVAYQRGVRPFHFASQLGRHYPHSPKDSIHGYRRIHIARPPGGPR